MTLGLVIKAVSKAPAFFRKLKEVKEFVTSTNSTATTPEELEAELKELPEETLNECLKKFMEDGQAIDLIKAQEEVPPEVMAKISTGAADEVAVMRQTTRPWAARMMIHFIFSPLYLVAIDVVQMLAHAWLFFWTDIESVMTFEYVFGVMKFSDLSTLEKVGSLIGQPQTLASVIYVDTVPWAAAIVLGYMGVREIGKGLGTSGDTPLSKLKSAGSGFFGLVGRLFKK